MPHPPGLDLGARRPTPTHGPAANPPRGAPDRAATPGDPGVHRAVCATGRGGEPPLARHATRRSAPESVPWLSAHAPPAAPHGDRHEYRPGDRLAQGRGSGRTPAAARPLGPAVTPAVVTPDGALLAEDIPNRVGRDEVWSQPTLLGMSRTRGKAALHRTFKGLRDRIYIPLVTPTRLTLEIDHRDLTNRLTTSFTLMGNSADSPEPLLRPSPTTSHDADMRDVEDPDLGYDAETCPYQPPQRGMRPTCRAGLVGGLCGNISIDSIVRLVPSQRWRLCHECQRDRRT
jgi:hypothetical protein